MSKFYIKDRRTGAIVPVTKEQFNHGMRKIASANAKKRK